MAAAGIGGLQLHQGFLYLAHGLAHPGAVERGGLVVACLGSVHVGGAASAVEQRQGQRQRADGPGVERGADATRAHLRHAHRAVEGEARVALGLGVAHVGAGGGHFPLGIEHIRALCQQLGGQGVDGEQAGLRCRRGRAGRGQQLAQGGLLPGGQGHQGLDVDVAQRLLLGQAALGIGAAGARQGGRGGGLEAGVG